MAGLAKPREGEVGNPESVDKIFLPGRKNPIVLRRGDPGLFLHAGSDPVHATNQQTTFGDGRTHTEYINVTWQLRDVNCDGKRDGGFNCIPGSHHATKVPSRSEAWKGETNLLENPDPLWE